MRLPAGTTFTSASGVLLRDSIPPAAPLVIQYAGAWRETFYGSRFLDGSDLLIVTANVTPSPRSHATLGPDTAVTFEQNTTSLNLNYQNSPALPDNYVTDIGYDPTLTGPWDVTATNPGTDNGIATTTTYAIGPQTAIEPVTDMRISGSVDVGMTLFWMNPTGSEGTNIDISEVSADGSSSQLVHQAFLAPGTSEYLIPEVLSPGVSLTADQLYEVSIRNVELGANPGEILARASTSFEFTATQEALDAYLPTVDLEGKLNFDNSVEAGTVINIDPFVAIGYDYLIGDPADPWFESVSFPSIGDGLFDLLLYNDDGSATTIKDVRAGEIFDFSSVTGGSGISSFGVRGIEKAAMLEPTDPLAFVTSLTFVGDGRFTGTMVPITVDILEPVVASIDIKPGDEENCFNANGHGVIPVAILGSADFEVAGIDQQSLGFNWLSVREKGNNMPQCTADDINGDGHLDLLCKFEDDLSVWKEMNGQGKVTGELYSGGLFEGSDNLCLVP